jgi:hypothetical protein
MIVVKPTGDQRRQARAEARAMGALNNSFTKGEGNEIGMMGEILIYEMLGGDRVGSTTFSYDIILSNGIKIDVKTTKAAGVPEPHYVARVYGSEAAKENLCTKCDVYYFVRCNKAMTLATIVGWMPAREFIEAATFSPRGSIDPNDGKLSYSDEYTLPISQVNPPSVKLTKKRVGK